MKVNITPRSNIVGYDLDLAPPLPGLQNDKDIQYNEDTKLKSKESSDLYYTFHKKLGIGYQGIKTNQQTCKKQYAPSSNEGIQKSWFS